MKVALLTYSTRPRGGVVHTLNLAEALCAAGCAVDVWSLARGDAVFFRSVDPAVGIRLVPFPAIDNEPVGARILRSIRALADAFDPAGYDIVHAQDCISANAVPDCIRTCGVPKSSLGVLTCRFPVGDHGLCRLVCSI